MGFKADFFSRLEPEAKRAVGVFALLPPPVSLDHLVDFLRMNPVKMLQLLDDLKESNLVSPCESAGTGHFRLDRPELAGAIIAAWTPEALHALALELGDFIERAVPDETVKSLAITNICALSGIDCRKIEHILTAARYCLQARATEAATIYFELILDRLNDTTRSQSDRLTYIDSALGMVIAHGHHMPLPRQRELLARAKTLAAEAMDMARLCQVDLYLAQIAKTEGNYTQAENLNEEAWQLAKQLGHEDLLRQAALFTGDFLFWQGRVADAVARYEQIIGDLESFPAEESTLRASATLGWCYGICGRVARGVSLIETVRQKAILHGFKPVRIYADLMSALTLLEARRLEEAETFLDAIFDYPEEDLGNYILWATYAAKGFILHKRGDLKSCFEFQKKAHAKSKAVGWPHHRGPWNFDYLDALEDAGFVHQEMNYESELNRLEKWPDRYMQGVGLRYRAQRLLKRNGLDAPGARPIIEKAIILLDEAGARIELAHARILLARIRLQDGDQHDDEAYNLLKRAWRVLSANNPDLFPEDLKPYLTHEQKEDFFIRTLIEIGEAIGTVRSRQRLLERIINLLLNLTKAGRGGIFLIGPDGGIQLVASRNLDTTVEQTPSFDLIRQMIRESLARGSQLVYHHDPSAGRTNPPGLAGWRIALPLILQDRQLGVIYLDNSLLGMMPPQECLEVLNAIAIQVAIALDNAQAYEEIERLKERLEDETRFYRLEIDTLPQNGNIIGSSRSIGQVLRQIHQVSPTDTSVLILGETGVGKELVAKLIHRLGKQREGPFIAVNASSLDPNLIASELFGHEKGAYTGASGLRRGRFELADGGTLFLDDIDTLTMDIQVKILRALQEKEFERVGGDRLIRSDFRLLAATNQDLNLLIENNRFRHDLYYRLNVFPIHIPPLRERLEDIPLLAVHFLEMFNQKFGKNLKGLNNRQIKELQQYPWPGNVRELKHVIERAAIMSEGPHLLLPDLDKTTRQNSPENTPLPSMREMERQHILAALSACGWRVSGQGGAAEILDLKPTTLYARIRKLGIEKKMA